MVGVQWAVHDSSKNVVFSSANSRRFDGLFAAKPSHTKIYFSKTASTGRVFLCPKLRKEHEMEQEKLCVIKEKSYEAHIDEKVHAVPVILSHW